MVLYNNGYCRISLNDFNLEDFNTKEGKITHMTNNSVQKKHPDYKEKKEETIIDMEELKNYLISEGKIESSEEFESRVNNKFKEIMRIIFLQVKDKLDRSFGCFELLGWDFLLDEDLNPYLIEININPALFTDTSTQKKIIPKLVNDTVQIACKLHTPNHSSSKTEDFNEVVEDLKSEGEEKKYHMEIIYQDEVETTPFV